MASTPPLTGSALIAGWNRTTAIASVLLRELGLTVFRLPPQGDEDPSLDRYTRSFHGSAIRMLAVEEVETELGTARILIHQRDRFDLESADLGATELTTLNPQLAVCEVTGFPAGGAWSGRPAIGRAAEAVSGLMRVTYPYAGDGPVYTPRPLSAYGTALLVVAAAEVALEIVRGTGRGASVAVTEVGGSLLPQVLNAVYPVEANGSAAPERDPDPLQVNTPTIRCYEASDGWMLIAAPSTDAWSRAAIAMGRADLAIDERFAGAPWALSGPDVRAVLTDEIASTVEQEPIEHWLDAFAAVNVPAAPVLTTAEFRRLDHPAESGAVRGAEAGGEQLEASMWKFAQDGGPAAGTAERDEVPASATADRLPLSGLKVVELATFAAAPYAGATLADLGAEVIKLEQPPGGDPYREQGYTFAQINRGKSSRALDLRQADAHAEFERLLRDADVLLINMRRAGLEKIGASFDAVAAVNPAIVYCWLTAWGSGGARENGPGVDPIFQSVSGQAYSNGGNSGALRLIPSGLLDNYTGMLAVAGILAGLERRRREGGAQYVETALLRGSIMAQLDDFLDLAERPDLGRDPVGVRALDRVYPASDRWIYLCVEDAAGWRAFTELIGRPELQLDHPEALGEAFDSALADELAELLRGRPAAHWLELLDALPKSAIAVPVMAPEELVDDAVLPGRELFVEVDDAQWGSLWQLRPMIDIPNARAEKPASAPLLDSASVRHDRAPG